MPTVDWAGDRLVAAARQVAKEVAVMTAGTVGQKSVDRCPKDTSHTRESKYVAELENGAEVGFNTPQAAWLHESQNYTPHEPGTGPGYLRQPLLEEEEQYYKDMAAALQAIFG